MSRSRLSLIRGAAVVGVLAGIGSLLVRLRLLGVPPATPTYEETNRLWFGALILVPVAVAVLSFGIGTSLATAGRLGATLAIGGSTLAAIGNLIEFQFGREQGFVLFGLGEVLYAFGLTIVAWSLRGQRGTYPGWIAIAILGVSGFFSTIAGPIGVVASFLQIGGWIVLGRGLSRETR